MTHRMVAATLSLVGLLVALYLWLWKLGLMGPMACGSGSCETVQLSPHAMFLGMPVAFYGVVGYAALLGVSLLGLQPRWQERREPTLWLAVLAGAGVAFTVYLTYLEAFVIEAWCRWCLVSAAIIGLIFVVSLVGLRRDRADGGSGHDERPADGPGDGGAEGIAPPEGEGREKQVSLRHTALPFGPFLAAGAVVYLFGEPWLQVGLVSFWRSYPSVL